MNAPHRAFTKPIQVAPFDWETASDREVLERIERQRYRAGDRYVTGKVLDPGDPEIGKLVYPEARDHSADYWRNYKLGRGEFEFLKPQPAMALEDAASWEGIEIPPRRWLLDGWLPIGEAALLTGAGSVGKSLVSQQLAATIAAGRPFMGIETERAKTLYLSCEDSREELQRRYQAIAGTIGGRIEPGACFVRSWKGELDLELATFSEGRRMEPTKRFHELREIALDTGIRFIGLDNTSHLFGGDENVKREVAAFVNLMNGLAAEIDGVVLLLGHPNKTGVNNPDAGDANQFGGSVSWENQVRSRMFMSLPDKSDPDARELSNPKANYSAKGNKLAFRWHSGAFIRQEDLPPDYAAELTQAIKANGENAAFLDCLRTRAEQGEGRLVGPSPGPNYAPAQFEGMAQAKGLKKPALKRAMERLFLIGAIESHTYRNTAKGRDVTIIREVPEGTPNASPNASRTLVPNTPEQSARTTPHTHSIPKGIPGAAFGAAAPDPDDLDWSDADD